MEFDKHYTKQWPCWRPERRRGERPCHSRM